jgi:hypothetical protein
MMGHWFVLTEAQKAEAAEYLDPSFLNPPLLVRSILIIII